MTTRALPDLVAVQRRTIRTLVAAQAVGAIGITIGIATASLLARDISGSESEAGLAQTFQVTGAAVAAYLLARPMSRPGRPGGLVTGFMLGEGGARADVPGHRGCGGVVPPGAADVARGPPRRTGDRLSAGSGRRGPGCPGRGRGLDGAPPGRRGAAGLHDRREQQRPVRRHRPR